MHTRSLPLLLALAVLAACSDSQSADTATTAPASVATTAVDTTAAPTTAEPTTTTEPPLTLQSLAGRIAIESTSCDEQLRETNNSPIGQICIVNLPDLSVANLSDPTIDETYPRWSPDGTRIAFTSLVSGANQRLVVANADGGGRVNVTGSRVYASLVDWSPDGSQFLIGSRAVAPSDGVELNSSADFTNLPTDENAWRPTWSPDGTRIAYSSDLYGTPDELECQTLFIATVDGSEVSQLFDDPAGGESLGPCVFDGAEWSPDGEWLLTTISDSEGNNLWVVRPDGSDLTQLTHGAFGGGRPNWSPDGKYIVYTGDGADGKMAVFVRTFAGLEDAQVIELALPAGLLNGANWVDWTA